jgi:hypothetical protein
MQHDQSQKIRERRSKLQSEQEKEPGMTVRFLLVLSIVVLLSLSSTAQNPSRIEVFGGYSHVGYYYYPAYQGPWTLSSFNGWEASAAFKLIPHLAAEADFGGLYGPAGNSCCPRDKIQTYLGGPRVSVNHRELSLYAHALFGGLRYRTSFGTMPLTVDADTTFAMAVGGGADLWLKRRFGVRMLQADYLRNNNPIPGYFAHPGQHENFRISTGVVFRF